MSKTKGKKSAIQTGPRVTRHNNSLEWKIIKSKESETTEQKSHRGSFSFIGASVEIKEFKAEGSSKLEGACLNHLSVDLVTIVAAKDVMNMDTGSRLEANDNSNNNLMPQEAFKPSPVEISTN